MTKMLMRDGAPFGPIAEFIDGAWKDDFDPGREESYYRVLRPYDAVDVLAAAIKLADRPSPFSPSAAEIRAAISVTAGEDAPDWPTARAAIIAAMATTPDREEGLRELRHQHPLLERFMAGRQGWVGPVAGATLMIQGSRDRIVDELQAEWEATLAQARARRGKLLETLAASAAERGGV